MSVMLSVDKVFLRSFNPGIVAKTGAPVVLGRERDGRWWEKFEILLKESLAELGVAVIEQKESLIISDQREGGEFCIYVHKTKRDQPHGDLFYMQMHMQELFVLDHAGWGADHSRQITQAQLDNVNVDLAERFTVLLREKFLTSGESKHPQKIAWWHRFQKVPKAYILAPLQIPRDSVIKHHSPISVYEYIEMASEWAVREKTHLVFKLHPHNQSDRSLKWMVRRRVWSSRYIHCVGGNIQEMIKDSSGLLLINSGTGFEALVHGKPVATMGQCDYKAVTYPADEKGLDGLKMFFEQYSDHQRLMAAKMVYTYCHDYAYYLAESELSEVKNRLKSYLKKRLAMSK
ncbi:MAG: hypothetical protein ACJAVI_005641 [Candidatus Azotimanducaceae bacterium]|jgi:hypothetical protein